MRRLTSTQQSTLDYIRAYIVEHGFPPSKRDICRAFNLRSTNAAHDRIVELEKQGYIHLTPRVARGIRLAEGFPVSNTQLYVIEGPDAVGKATQAAMLADYLETRVIAFPRYETETGKLIKDLLMKRIEVVKTPGPSTPVSDAQRRDAMVLQQAMTFDRYTCKELWEHDGPLVLDRYWMSAWVYGGLDGLNAADLMQAHRGLPRPTHSFLLDVPLEQQVERLRARGREKDRYEDGATAFLERVRNAYLRLWDDESLMLADPCPLGRDVTIIDGTGTPEAVHRRIIGALSAAALRRKP